MRFTKRGMFQRMIAAAMAVAITSVILTQNIFAEEIPAEQAGYAEPAPEEPVTADLVIFAGQSNMAGCGGSAALAPYIPEGAGAEYRPLSEPGDLHEITEPFGARESGGAASGTGTLVSSFISTYYARTGVPIVAVSAARGATDSAFWASSKVRSELLNKFVLTKSYMQSNNIILRRAFVVWLQGESDAIEGVSPEKYQANLLAAFNPLFVNGLERVYVITPGKSKGNIVSYDSIIQAQVALCLSDARFTLASNALQTMPESALKDELHYGQLALNTVGAEAANAAAR